METIKRLQLEIDKGFSKSDLERIVSLPMNTLSSILTGKRKMTQKHELSVAKFLDEHPILNPLDYPKRTRKTKPPKSGELKETKKERGEKNFTPTTEKQMPKGLSLMQQLEWRETNQK